LVQTALQTMMLLRWHSLPTALSCTTRQCTESTVEGRTYRVLSLPSGTPTPAHARGRVVEPTWNDNTLLSDKIMTRYVTIQFCFSVNTRHLHYKYHIFNGIYGENHRGHGVDTSNVKVCGWFCYHCAIQWLDVS
jgi:hypothetical protein